MLYTNSGHMRAILLLSTNCFLQIVSFLRCHFRSEKPFLKTEQIIIIIIIINELLFANSFSREGIFNGKKPFLKTEKFTCSQI